MKNTIILIPARLGSTRFPNKPLVDIKGKTMIERVCQQGAKAGISEIIVACSEIEVKEIVEQAGYQAVMTDPDLPSGTDRIYAALEQLKPEQQIEYIVNLQGDLPDIKPEIIKETLEVFKHIPNTDIATAVVPIADINIAQDPNIVKAVVDFSAANYAEAHYFSRSAVPYNAKTYYEHIGLYVYKKAALDKFVTLPEALLESTEKLEQLRAISAGMKISACLIPYQDKPISIDTPEDLARLLDS